MNMKTITLEQNEKIIIKIRGGVSYELTVYQFYYGLGLCVEPIGASYIPVCKALAERPDLCKAQIKEGNKYGKIRKD